MKETTNANAGARELQFVSTNNPKPQTQVTATLADLKALQDKASQLLRPHQYGGYAGL